MSEIPALDLIECSKCHQKYHRFEYAPSRLKERVCNVCGKARARAYRDRTYGPTDKGAIWNHFKLRSSKGSS